MPCDNGQPILAVLFIVSSATGYVNLSSGLGLFIIMFFFIYFYKRKVVIRIKDLNFIRHNFNRLNYFLKRSEGHTSELQSLV